MELRIPAPELVPFGLRAMKMIALASGTFDDAERNLLATAQRFFGTQIDLDSLPPIEPEELAAHLVDPVLRRLEYGRVSSSAGYRGTLRWLNALANRVAGIVQSGSLPVYIGIVLLTAALVPGLLMLTLLSESTSNASFGIYMPRFTGAIYELLSAPVGVAETLIGFVGAAAAKSLILAAIILATATLFVDYTIAHPFYALVYILLVSASFSLFGFILGIWADGFEKLQIVPLLILWFGVSERVATGTSMLAIAVIGAFGAIGQAFYGNVDLLDGLLVGIPAVGGVVAGAAIQQRIPERTISLLFAGLLVIVAIRFLVG